MGLRVTAALTTQSTCGNSDSSMTTSISVRWLASSSWLRLGSQCSMPLISQVIRRVVRAVQTKNTNAPRIMFRAMTWRRSSRRTKRYTSGSSRKPYISPMTPKKNQNSDVPMKR